MATVEINLTNLTCKFSGNLKVLNKLREELKYRHPQGWYLREYMPKGWDGYMRLMTDKGYLPTGFLPRALEWLEERDVDYDITDQRELVEPVELPDRIQSFDKRDYQRVCINAVINNYVGGQYFPRGVISAATNAGKSVIMAGITLCYPKMDGLILINDGTLYKQMVKDMPTFYKDWGQCQGKTIRWGKVTVAMVQTLVRHLDEYRDELSSVGVLLVDECDLSTSKTYKKVLKYIPNAFVRVGLSGTIFIRNMAKDRPKNNTVIGQFGAELFKIKNKELMELGYSTPVVIKINMGNRMMARSGDYDGEYKEGIVRNSERNLMWVNRARYYLKQDIKHILVVAKLHEHVEELYRLFIRNFGNKYSIKFVHKDTPTKDRDSAIEAFREGTLDILISSFIIKRGQNMPLIRVILNAAGGDSPEGPLQIIGRGTRTHESKDKVYYEDAYDKGAYLERHSKHRMIYYKNEGLKIILLPPLSK